MKSEAGKEDKEDIQDIEKLEETMNELFNQFSTEINDIKENEDEENVDKENVDKEDRDKENVDQEIKKNEEFEKIIIDFAKDLYTTFPDIIDSQESPIKNICLYIDSIPEHKEEIELSCKLIYEHCIKVFPKFFFDILYENSDIFGERENMYLIPGVNFVSLWNSEISDNTKSTLWKYLKLILFTVIGDLNSDECFGDSAKLFEAINNEEFKEKIQSSLEEMEEIFNKENEDSEEARELPNAEQLHDHINNMMHGKLGCLAKEIAEETAQDLDIDVNNVSSVNDVFNKLFKNPTKLMDLVKNVGSKLDTKIKSGDIKESELLKEASEFVSNMKNMPGIGNIESFLSKMGLPGMPGGGKVNMGAFNKKMEDNLKNAKAKDRMRAKLDKRKQESNLESGKINTNMGMPEFKYSSEETVEKSESTSKPKVHRKKKKKKPPNVVNSSKE